MDLLKRYLLSLLAPLALLVSCEAGETPAPEVDYVFFIKESNIRPGSTTAVIDASYVIDPTATDLAAEAGIRYARKGVAGEKDVAAEVLSPHFTVVLRDLTPQTDYVITAYVRTTDGRVFLSDFTREFTTTDAGGPSSLLVGVSKVDPVLATEAVFHGVYALMPDDGPITGVGFKYRKQGEDQWTSVTSAGVDTPFSYNCTGLSPETVYEVRAWAEMDGVVREGIQTPHVFTTASEGPGPGPTVTQFLWAELPVMEEDAEFYYVTHYVSSNGQATAKPTDKGRVRNYTICYDPDKLQSLWVAYPMHPFYDGNNGRSKTWSYNDQIPSSLQPKLSSSYKGGYSRGHQIASGDRQLSSAMNKQTFVYTNSTPQIQDGFNGGIWNNLENAIQAIGFNWSDTLYVATGPAFLYDKGNATDNDSRAVPVASHFYKVLLSSKSDNTGKSIGQLKASELRCVGFWLEHKVYSNSTVSKTYMKSVSEIEDLTGLTFFPMLSEEARSVKDTYNPSDWDM